jgi:hypothetical protein
MVITLANVAGTITTPVSVVPGARAFAARLVTSFDVKIRTFAEEFLKKRTLLCPLRLQVSLRLSLGDLCSFCCDLRFLLLG